MNSSTWKNDTSSSWQALKANSLPPRWVEDIEKVEEDISNIEAKSKLTQQSYITYSVVRTTMKLYFTGKMFLLINSKRIRIIAYQALNGKF